MVYILTSNSVTSLCSFTPSFVSTASIGPLLRFGVVIIVFFAVITGHLLNPFKRFTNNRELFAKNIFTTVSNLLMF
jgi:hypothetical protein